MGEAAGKGLNPTVCNPGFIHLIIPRFSALLFASSRANVFASSRPCKECLMHLLQIPISTIPRTRILWSPPLQRLVRSAGLSDCGGGTTVQCGPTSARDVGQVCCEG